MKILFVNKFLYPNGGSETYIFELGRCLQQMGHEVQYFGMEHEGRIVGNGLNLYTSDMDFHGGGIGGKLRKLTYPFKIIYSKDAARKISRILDDFKPDVVHFNNINFQLTPSVIEAVADYDIRNHKDTKMVATAHDYQWVCPNHMMKRPSDGQVCFECEGGRYGCCTKNKCIHGSTVRSLLGTIEANFYKSRGTYGLLDTVIAPSEFLKDKLETNPELFGKCVTMHNFMVSNPEGAEHTDTEKAEDKDNTSKYVLYFGRFSEEKGIKTLIEACRRLPDIGFVFAGSGPLKDAVDDVPNIEDVGFLKPAQMHRMISDARFVVFPSEWYENCPFSVMETQQFGTPIIASDLGGTPELVKDGVTGELFKAGDVEDLTSRIRSLYEDDVKLERYEQGCKDIRFDSVSDYCNKLLNIYED